MKLAILGTRGIPNAYGGFEQFAEYLSVYLADKGHETYVYNSHLHPYQESEWNGVKIIHCRDWEDKIGTAGQFIYDLNCIRDARKRNFDLILQLGYTSSSVWASFLPKAAKIMTNMDGLEWKRSKYSPMVQRFLRFAEKWAVRSSDMLIADSRAIESYLKAKHGVRSTFIPYGAPIATKQNEEMLISQGLTSDEYDMLLARMEPENNIETILDGYVRSSQECGFVVIGDNDSLYSRFLRTKYKDQMSIRFLGAIYDSEKVDALRQNARLYFHGHSVGGTNPSLLEAMGCSCCIVAHDNEFNKDVLGEYGRYFASSDQVAEIMDSPPDDQEVKKMVEGNLLKIRGPYSWEAVNAQYEQAMIELIATA